MISTRIGRRFPSFRGRKRLDWPTLLDRHGVEFALLDRQGDRDLVTRLRSHPSWVVDEEGEESLLFRRRSN